MSKNRPLAPMDQKGFISLDEITLTETLLAQLCEVIYAENAQLKRDPAASPKALASLVLQLQLVMDELLGEKTPVEERFAVKIPSVFFRDFAHPQGILKHLLFWALQFRQQYQKSESIHFSRRFELNSGKNKQFSIDLIKYLWEMLKKKNMWVQPKIFFLGYFTEEEASKNHFIVTNLSGVVVDKVEEATHIVVPERVIDPNDTEYYYRILERRGYKIFVHWWYFPDSYDTWIFSGNNGNQSIVSTKASSKEERLLIAPEDGVWTLSIEWLEQSSRYNEWLNEADFELTQLYTSSSSEAEDLVKPQSQRKQKRLRSSSSGFSGQTKKTRRRHSGLQITKCITDETSLETGKVFKKYRVSSSEISPHRTEKSLERTERERRSDSIGLPYSERKKLKKIRLQTRRGDEPSSSQSFIVTLSCAKPSKEKCKVHYKSFRECSISEINFKLKNIPPDGEIPSALTCLDDVDQKDQERAKDIILHLAQIESYQENIAPQSGRERNQENTVTELGYASQTGAKSQSRMSSASCMKNDLRTTLPSISSNSEVTSIAPGVVRYTRRFLSHSVSNTNPRHIFERLRSLNPLAHDCNTNLLTGYDSSKCPSGNSSNAVETALKTMVALWASTCDYPYIFGSRGSSEKEDPDIPPMVIEEQKSAMGSRELDATFGQISSFERTVLEDTHKRNLSEQLDMFEATGMTPEKAAQIPVVLPDAAQKWFSLDTVHLLERDIFSSWFKDKEDAQNDDTELYKPCNERVASSEEKVQYYVKMRNAIVKRYRVNPLRYLTVSHCRQFIDIDVGLLLKLHSFLDFWGVINFQSLPHTRPSRIYRPLDFHLYREQANNKNVGFNEQKKPMSSTFHQAPLVHCLVCKRRCPNSYYILKPSLAFGVPTALAHRVAWCLQCFAEGRFPESLTHRQFAKVSNTRSHCENGDVQEADWTDDELEKLIDGIELHGENWEAVAKHVGSRNAFECISHFLRLPLDEPLLHSNMKGGETCNIFQKAANPLMTQLKFLTAVFGSQFGSRVAKSSYDSLLGQLNEKMQSLSFEGKLEDSAEKDEKIKRLLEEEFQKPIAQDTERVAIENVLRTAASLALEYAEEEEIKIRKLMGHLNHLKEIQIKRKAIAFFTQKNVIIEKADDFERKVNECVEMRNELKAALASAHEQHEKLFNDVYRQDKGPTSFVNLTHQPPRPYSFQFSVT